MDGQPTGSVRVSFGYMSTFEDCQKFLNFVAECFVEKPATADPVRLHELRAGGAEPSPSEERLDGRNHEAAETKSTGGPREGQGHLKVPGDAVTLTNIYVYPVKSCAAMEVSAARGPSSGCAGPDPDPAAVRRCRSGPWAGGG